jgi:hypothetical protein
MCQRLPLVATALFPLILAGVGFLVLALGGALRHSNAPTTVDTSKAASA